MYLIYILKEFLVKNRYQCVNRLLAVEVKLFHDFYHTHTCSCLQVLCKSILHSLPLFLSFILSLSLSLSPKYSQSHCIRINKNIVHVKDIVLENGIRELTYVARVILRMSCMQRRHLFTLSMHMASQLTHYFIKENTFCNLSYKDYFEHIQIQIRKLFIWMCVCACVNEYVYGHLIWLWGYFAFVSVLSLTTTWGGCMYRRRIDVRKFDIFT